MWLLTCKEKDWLLPRVCKSLPTVYFLSETIHLIASKWRKGRGLTNLPWDCPPHGPNYPPLHPTFANLHLPPIMLSFQKSLYSMRLKETFKIKSIALYSQNNQTQGSNICGNPMHGSLVSMLINLCTIWIADTNSWRGKVCLGSHLKRISVHRYEKTCWNFSMNNDSCVWWRLFKLWPTRKQAVRQELWTKALCLVTYFW